MDKERKQRINEYLLGVRAGDRSSLTKLHAELSATIWHIAIKYLRVERDADDLVQDFWSEIEKIAQGFLIPVNAYSYLCKVATRKAINRFHKLHKIEKAKVTAVDYTLFERDNLDDDDEDRDTIICLEEAISKLDEIEIIVIQSTFFEEKTVREIAIELNTSKSNVSKIKIRAIAKLKEALGVESEDDDNE